MSSHDSHPSPSHPRAPDSLLPDPRAADFLSPDPRAGFDGKVALITGGSRGIGRELALRLAARGTTTIVNYKQNQELARSTVDEIERLGATGVAIRADLESLDEIEAMFDQVQEQFGRLDFFISNASASNFHHFMDIKPHHLERSFNLNVRAFVLGTQRAVRLMHDGGRIVVLSSYGSIRSFPTYANLGSAKAALETWARYMAVELAPRGINVNAVNGGIIATDSSSYFYATGRVPSLDTVVPKIPKRRMGTAAEVAECCVFLLSPGAEYVTGTSLVVDGGLTSVAPPFHADIAGAADAPTLDALSELLR
jgi:NAD(P)-dependent dehydrogenase (short-subunit alcohol dehydrogenase family)